MAVYREGYHLIEQIQKNNKQVFNDAGMPVAKGDKTWTLLGYVAKAYGIPGSRRQPGTSILSITIELMDEWTVSDGRKTKGEAIDRFRITYYSLKRWKNKPYLNPEFKDADGFISFSKLSN